MASVRASSQRYAHDCTRELSPMQNQVTSICNVNLDNMMSVAGAVATVNTVDCAKHIPRRTPAAPGRICQPRECTGRQSLNEGRGQYLELCL